MKTNLILSASICIFCSLAACSVNTPSSGCNNPNSNVFFTESGVSSSGIGRFHYEGPNNYMIFGVVGGCNPNNPTDTMLRINVPHFIPDTPYTYQIVDYNSAGPNDGFLFPNLCPGCTTTTSGALTIDSISADSFAYGNFHCVGIYNGSTIYNIPDGIFTHVKITF